MSEEESIETKEELFHELSLHEKLTIIYREIQEIKERLHG
jgi:hypothetical protein